MVTERIDLPQGTLDLLMLKTLALGPRHGWSISERIQQISRDVLQVQQGSLYPALHRLERRGWIKARWGSSDNNRRAKYYELTRTGRRQLGVETEAWRKLAGAVGHILDAVDLLLGAGVKIDVPNRDGMTPLAMACLYGNVSMINRLIKGGADARQRGPSGETMIMLAARNGQPESIYLLVAAGAQRASVAAAGTTTCHRNPWTCCRARSTC